MRHLFCAFTCAASLWPGPASAQDYLDQQGVEDLLRENAFCYYLQPDGSCGWVEIFDTFDAPETHWFLATSFDVGDLSVIEQVGTWINDMLCIREGDFGIVGLTGGAAPFVYFDLRLQTPRPDAEIVTLIEQLAQDVLPKTCFRYTPDPARPGGLLQHTFADGARQEGEDPITLVPLSQGSVRIATGT